MSAEAGQDDRGGPVPGAGDEGDASGRSDGVEDERSRRVLQRLALVERDGELHRLLRRTRLTAPVWAAGAVFFVWSGWATGNWPAALSLGAFAALAAGVNVVLRRRRLAELAEVQARLEALPPPGEADTDS